MMHYLTEIRKEFLTVFRKNVKTIERIGVCLEFQLFCFGSLSVQGRVFRFNARLFRHRRLFFRTFFRTVRTTEFHLKPLALRRRRSASEAFPVSEPEFGRESFVELVRAIEISMHRVSRLLPLDGIFLTLAFGRVESLDYLSSLRTRLSFFSFLSF